MAEREGFEPPEAFTSSVFKTDALNHSTISPQKNNDKKTCVDTQVIISYGAQKKTRTSTPRGTSTSS